MTELKSCFVISPIGDENTQVRHRSDQVLKHIIRPAAKEAGYNAKRADEIDKPGLITSQVIQCVISDPLVIADLTGMNPNVFYELAIRHAIRKPLVQLIQKGERIPFDVAATRTIHVDHQDLDSVDAAKKQIIAQIQELEASPEVTETPISVSMDLQILRQSDDPEDRSFAEIISELTDLKATTSKIEEQLENYDPSLSRNFLSKLERYTYEGRRADRRSPRMMLEFIDEVVFSSEMPMSLVVAVVTSMFRDSAPWLYMLGTELHQKLATGSKERARKTIRDFTYLSEMTVQSSAFREMMEFRGEEEYFLLRKSLDMLLERLHQEVT